VLQAPLKGKSTPFGSALHSAHWDLTSRHACATTTVSWGTKVSEGYETTLEQLIDDPVQYQVPLYQRTYSLSEKQLSQFRTDLITVANQFADGRSVSTHFLGSMVLAPIPSISHPTLSVKMYAMWSDNSPQKKYELAWDLKQPLSSSDVWSGRRESNPRSQLGKLMFCR
jgi:hypothetical protein